MLRGSRASTLLLAPAIPRQVWDPKHHNYKHVDSYAKAIADRRVWPAKKWAVGTEPRVKDDWNKFSLRNIAYQYNAKLRACNNFPEMIPVYAEMKVRGAKMDTDTMVVMLSRGARFTSITANDLFLLFDEMLSFGAKPDIAVIEILQTILEHAPHDASGAWKEAKRLQLISHYDALCAEEVQRLGAEQLGNLMQSQVARYRKNIAALNGKLSLETWKQYISLIPTVEILFEELAQFLGEFVPKKLAEDFPRTEMRFTNPTSIPHLYRHNALSRPTNKPASSSNSKGGADSAVDSVFAIPYTERMAYRARFEDDLAINEVMLSALERFIDTPLETKLPRCDEPALLLLFEKFVKSTGVLVTADLAAQMMEVCKFATNFSTEAAAARVMQMAYHGSAVPNTPYRLNWKLAEIGVDGRVLGRFLGARNPWGGMRFDLTNNGKFGDFKALDSNGGEAPTAAADETAEGEAVTDEEKQGKQGGKGAANNKNSNKSSATYTAAAVRERWESVQKAVKDSGCLDFDLHIRAGQPIDGDAMMEVFTGQACFLRNMFLEERYPPTEEQLRAAGQLNTDPDALVRNRGGSVASRNVSLEACDAIFKALQELKRSLETHLGGAKTIALSAGSTNAAFVGGATELVPDLECWESMLLVSKHMLDFLLTRRDQNGQSGRQLADDLFKQVASFRQKLLEESRSKCDGRFKILWLQEM